jgi:F-type H+-transporting ATPase subunit b
VQDIERARDQAMDELFAHMGRVVSEATEQVIGRALTGADNDRLIDEALSGFAQRKH